MKIIAVVGTGSGCGKTTLACRVLREIPGLGAVKISPREGASRVEWGAGEPGKDTALYAAHGAVRVARIIGPREAVGSTWELIKDQFEGCRGVVIEGASALNLPEERFVVFVVGESTDGLQQNKDRAIEAKSTLVIDRSSHFSTEALAEPIRKFLAVSTNQ